MGCGWVGSLRSHRTTVPRPLPVAKVRPSGAKTPDPIASAVGERSSPMRPGWSGSRTSQKIMRPSLPAIATVLPSGTKIIESTIPVLAVSALS